MREKTNKKKYRQFNIAQNLFHPETGETLLTEEKIKDTLNKYKSIKEWAYILHDKDTYTEDDENEEKRGQKKADHFHIVLNMGNNPYTIDTVARWFGIPSNYVNVIRGGEKGFLDCVEYLTHEDERQQLLEKHLYSDEEVIANFDFRERLNIRNMDRVGKAKMGIFKDNKEKYRYKVMFEGMTLRQVIEEDKMAYLEDFKMLEKMRLDYISERAPIPEMRVNYYITGKGGNGKGVISRALARNLFPNLHDKDCFFVVGSRGALFEGYDGQPVIIWEDRRAVDLLYELGSRGNVFNVFDTFPSAGRQNIKYGSVNLVNRVNIVNSVESYEDFLNGLAGEYIDKAGNIYVSEDKNQSYRRFPFIIPIKDNEFDLMVNKGFLMEGTYQEYAVIMNIKRSVKKVMDRVGSNTSVAGKIMGILTEPAISEYKKLWDRREELRNVAELSEEELLEDARLAVAMAEIEAPLLELDTEDRLKILEGLKGRGFEVAEDIPDF